MSGYVGTVGSSSDRVMLSRTGQGSFSVCGYGADRVVSNRISSRLVLVRFR